MKKLTKLLTLSLTATALMACDAVVAQPKPVIDGENLVTFSNGDSYFNNDFEVVYNKLVDSGTSNSTILEEITSLIAKKEIRAAYSFTEEDVNNIFANVTKKLANKTDVATYSAEHKADAESIEAFVTKRVEDTMIEKAKADTYAVDSLFQERKLVNELRTSLYTINGDQYQEDYLITPDSTYQDIFKCDYTEYIEKTIYPDVYKELLTSVYLYQNKYTSLGRAFARDVKYIKLENITNHNDSVSVLINAYFKAFEAKTLPSESFDLYSLARIYKGVFSDSENELETKERQFIKDNELVTRADTIKEDLAKVVEFENDEPTDKLLPENDRKRDAELTSSYTGSYTYLPSWGKTLKEREVEKLDIVTDDGLAIKSSGVSELPQEIKDRLFSNSITSYLKEVNGVKFLTPKTTLNSTVKDPVSQYAHFDSSSNSYYIVIVDGSYNTSYLKTDPEKTKPIAYEIARILGKSATSQKEALVHYLDKYDLQFGDQDFYDYIESTYPEVLDDSVHYEG